MQQLHARLGFEHLDARQGIIEDPPRLIGRDASGVVAAVGAGRHPVQDGPAFKTGQEVLHAGDLTRSGSNAGFQLIDITRAEAGCLQYDLHQDTDDPARFMFYENWESRELWETHMNARLLKDAMAATEGAVEAFTLNEVTRIA